MLRTGGVFQAYVVGIKIGAHILLWGKVKDLASAVVEHSQILDAEKVVSNIN